MLLSAASAMLVTASGLALLALAVSRLRPGGGLRAALEVLVLITLKFIALAGGLYWCSSQAWFRPGAAAAGIALSLTGFLIWKGRSNSSDKVHG